MAISPDLFGAWRRAAATARFRTESSNWPLTSTVIAQQCHSILTGTERRRRCRQGQHTAIADVSDNIDWIHHSPNDRVVQKQTLAPFSRRPGSRGGHHRCRSLTNHRAGRGQCGTGQLLRLWARRHCSQWESWPLKRQPKAATASAVLLRPSRRDQPRGPARRFRRSSRQHHPADSPVSADCVAVTTTYRSRSTHQP